MEAGKLNRIIAIERQAETVTASGSVSKVWASIATLRAEVVQRSAVETFTGFGSAEDGTTIFRVRYRPGIKTTDRVIYAGVAYDLKEINEIGRRRGLELRAVSTS